MSQKLTKTLHLTDIVRVLQGTKNGREWKLLVVNRDLRNDEELIKQLISRGVQVINCGAR